MQSCKPRPTIFAGRALVAILMLLASAYCFAASDDLAVLLQRADTIKTADNSAFLNLLQQLNAQADRLTPVQRDWLAYLKAWQSAYQGDFPGSQSALKLVLERTRDSILRARVRITLLNSQALASHYVEAYTNLNDLLESLPQIQDRTARNLSYGVAATLYNSAGQYDLAVQYADLWLADSSDSISTCKATPFKIEALYKSGKLHADDPQLRSGIDACRRIGDLLFGNAIRTYAARIRIDQGHAADALQLLLPHDAEMLATHSASSIANFRSLIARCYLLIGDPDKAREYAQSAVDFGIKQAYSKPVGDAYEVLYQVAKQQGDTAAALDWHEKFAAADKGYLSDISARALAYQMVRQQVQGKKLQIDALSKQNQVLQLRQTVNKKDAEARDLYLVLLLVVLGSIALYAYRTKRSQLKFQKLARRDGLTGIFNRQHFIEASGLTLAYGAKSVRDACMVMLDLDHFKDVNDVHGHAAGDMVLKRTVAACQKHLRSMDVFGRLGGEEFGILMPDCVPERAFDLAESMRKEIAGLSDCADDKTSLPVHASFGISAARWSGYDLPQLLAHADSALYQAKREGRNRVAMHGKNDVDVPRDRRHH